MAKRRSFTQQEKQKHRDAYREAVKSEKGLQYLKDNKLSSSHIASFESSLGIGKAKKPAKKGAKSPGLSNGDEMVITLWGKSGTIPEIKTALQTAVVRLGGKVSWSKP